MSIPYGTRQGANDDDAWKGLLFNLICLHHKNNQSKEQLSFSEAIKNLEGHIRQLLNVMETEKKKKVACFKIGKSIVKKSRLRRLRRKSSDEGELVFDCMNPDSWDLRHIKNRWLDNKKSYDALVVLVAITQKEVPKNKRMNQEEYAIECEQELIQIFKNDPRNRNKYGKGKKAEATPHAGIVYLAIKFVDKAKGKMKILVKKD